MIRHGKVFSCPLLRLFCSNSACRRSGIFVLSTSCVVPTLTRVRRSVSSAKTRSCSGNFQEAGCENKREAEQQTWKENEEDCESAPASRDNDIDDDGNSDNGDDEDNSKDTNTKAGTAAVWFLPLLPLFFLGLCYWVGTRGNHNHDVSADPTHCRMEQL